MQYVLILTQYDYTKNSLYLFNVEIEKVFVNDTLVEYEYNDNVAELTLGSNTTIAHHQVYKSRYLNALRESDEGELSIKLPTDCIVQVKTTALSSTPYADLLLFIRHLNHNPIKHLLPNSQQVQI